MKECTNSFCKYEMRIAEWSLAILSLLVFVAAVRAILVLPLELGDGCGNISFCLDGFSRRPTPRCDWTGSSASR